MRTDELRTTSAVVEALGGYKAVAEMTGRKYSAAWNWAHAKHFPANTYVTINAALMKSGKRAPASLWRMAEPCP